MSSQCLGLRRNPPLNLFARALSTIATTSSHHSVRSLCANGLLSEALSLFYSLETPFDAQTYSDLFHACARHRHLPAGDALHRHMLNRHPNHPPSLTLGNHILNMYAKCGQLELAHQLFDEMPAKNIVSWTALVSGYSQFDRPGECFRVFSSMLDHVRPTEFAYASVLSSCGYDEGRQVHALALKTSFDAFVYVSNALISMYSKNSFTDNSNGRKDEALAVFEGMQCHDLVSWNALIEGFETRGCWKQAIAVFSSIHRDGISFDRATLLSTISSLSAIDPNVVSLGFKYLFQLHCLCIRTGFIGDVKVSTVLLKAYSNLGADLYDCYRLFTDTGNNRDVVVWNEIIGALASQNPRKALSMFCELLHQEGFSLDRYTILSALKACAGLMDDHCTSVLHSLVLKGGFEEDILLANALIHAYCRCGSLVMSKRVFDEMGSRDTVSWNTLLKAYALLGESRDSLEIFSNMDVKPDGATFVSVLVACSRGGLVEEGARVFNEMYRTYGVVPEKDHYSCMVDLYGRAGLIKEAERMLRSMPMEPDAVVWVALLGACNKHNETRLAKVALEELKKLDSDKSLGHVLMSSIYFSDGSFNEALLMRNEMKGSRVRKNPGLSWVGG